MLSTPATPWSELPRYLSALDTVQFREYQETIGSMAATRNTLVIMPTALGKTIIALKAAMLRLQQYPWGKVIVLAPTRPLVEQHATSFTSFLRCKGGEPGAALLPWCELSGKVPRASRASLFAGASLVFATPQTLSNDIASGAVDMGAVVLVVLDECHRTAQRYAYNAIAASYMARCPDPVILALTASPGRTSEQVLDLCERLHIEQVATRTLDDEDVLPYVNPIEVDVQRCRMPLVYDEIDCALKGLLHARVARLQACRFLKEKPAEFVNKMDVIQLGRILWSIVARELGADLLDGGDGAGEQGDSPAGPAPATSTRSADRTGFFFWLVSLQSQCMKLLHLAELVGTQSMHAGKQFLRRMHDKHEKSARKGGPGSQLLKEPALKRVEIAIDKAIDAGHLHPKTAATVELLESFLPADGSGARDSVIVFTQYRDTVDHLVDVIERCNGGDAGPCRRFRPVRFVGQATKIKGNAGQSQKEQRAVLDAFRAGVHNVLVATRIAEEGLDIPSVGHIIFYEPVPSEIRYIQRRGRTGRHGKGFVTILVAEGTLDEVFLNVAFSRARAMNEIAGDLAGKPLQRIHRLPINPPPAAPAGAGAGTPASACDPPGRRAAPRAAPATAPVSRDGLDSPGPGAVDPGAGVDVDLQGEIDRYDALIARFPSSPGLDDGWDARYMAVQGHARGRAVDWHGMLKRCTRPASTAAPATGAGRPRMKRTGMKKFGASGIPTREKLMTWIFDQVNSLGRDVAGGTRKEMSLDELVDLASFEEIVPEEFTYNLERGAKLGHWTVTKDTGGKKTVSLGKLETR